MSRSDDLLSVVRKAFGDKPAFFIAGASDLLSEKLRDLPEALGSLQKHYGDVPMRVAGDLVGQAFRANLRAGQLYDEITRRGEEVVARMDGVVPVAEEDEPFVREPYMPEPVHPVPEKAAVGKARPKKATTKKATTKKAAAKKGSAKKGSGKAAKAGT